MKIVAENYAESLGGSVDPGGQAFLAAVIGEHLRAGLDGDAAIPDRLQFLLDTLDRADHDRRVSATSPL